MTALRRNALYAAGYAGWFLFAFAVFLFLTFDAAFIADRIEKEAARRGVSLDIEKISISPLLSVTLKNLKIAPKPRVEKTDGLVPMKIDRVKVSPTLWRIPGAALAAVRQKQPRVAFSFAASIDKGRIGGSYDSGPTSLFASLKVRDLPLERITIPAYYMEGMQVKGAVKSLDFELKIKDVDKPEDWTGGLNLSLGPLEVSDFKFYIYPVVGFKFDPGGSAAASIKGGTVEISGIKMTGDLSPDLKGSIALKNPVGSSLIDLSGTFAITDDYKNRMPLILQLIPDPNKYVLQGPLRMVIPSLR
jgi:type II secretion system protein N